MPITKATFLVTVLFDTEEIDLVSDIDLVRISEAMDEGPAIGTVSLVSSIAVEDDQVLVEEAALGGDGTFFSEWKLPTDLPDVKAEEGGTRTGRWSSQDDANDFDLRR